MNESDAPARRLNAQVAEEAAQWFVANRDGSLPAAQAQAFMQWLQASPEHVAEYMAVAAIAKYAPAAAAQDPATLKDVLAAMQAEDNVVPLPSASAAPVFEPTRSGDAQRGSRGGRRRSIAVWCAGLAAMLVLAVGMLTWSTGQADVRSYATAHGEQATWTLPDGTELRLNSESAVTIRFDRKKRQVNVVHGQALFDIAQQPSRPFEVRAGAYLIEDIGTIFDVYRQAGETTVTVVEGQVHIWNLPDAELRSGTLQQPLADLRSGQRAHMSASGVVRAQSTIDPDRALAWTREEIAFEDEPLAEVVTEFNRYSRVQVRVGDESLGELRVSGTFGIRDEDTFHAFLDSLPGARTATTADGVTVLGDAEPGLTAER
ncbi:FecR domain-containing protein [Lysobacter korlensis]|uniref:FecR domain-containing protein n=1 Tax=Lysobacter korlensis TaxID=553636 RepID=A0ABV6RSH1_9GAMM